MPALPPCSTTRALLVLTAILASLSACGGAIDDSQQGGSSADGGLVDGGGGGGDVDAMPQVAEFDRLLGDLRSDRDAALLAQSNAQGWPAPVEGGYLFVSTTPGATLLAGDHDDWQGTAMTADDGFYWIVVDVGAGSRYKFTDGASQWIADSWSRAYDWDDEGLMSMTPPAFAHRERYFEVADSQMQARSVRVWVPEGQPTHLLYVHDGQNLFNPNAAYGGWQLNVDAPAGLMMVGIDNTPARMDEYTQVVDHLDSAIGGQGASYAAFVQDTVRPLIRSHYGEPDRIGTMGSSLGGLISLYIVDQYPGEYDFAASLSGTVGWGSIGTPAAETIIDRYQAAGHRDTALYIDSGGGGDTCADLDGDGTEDDDPSESDNYCETRQLERTLVDMGYQYDVDLWHWWEPGAQHNEAAWAARVFRPIQDFMSL